MEELKNEFTTDYNVDDSDSDNWILKAKGQEVTIPAGEKEEVKTATLQGSGFCYGGNLYQVYGNGSNIWNEITEVIQSNFKPSNDIMVDSHLWSTSDSEYPVYFWLEDNKLYYWTEASHIYLNKDVSNMFKDWSKLKNIDFIQQFNTSRTENMSFMFWNCTTLTDFSPIKNFNVSNVTNMKNMFTYCSGMSNIDLSKWNTINVKEMSQMFAGCSNLTTIYASTNFVVSSLTDSGNAMFGGCSLLEGGNGTKYNVSNINATMAQIDTAVYENETLVSGVAGYFTAK